MTLCNVANSCVTCNGSLPSLTSMCETCAPLAQKFMAIFENVFFYNETHFRLFRSTVGWLIKNYDEPNLKSGLNRDICTYAHIHIHIYEKYMSI